MSILAETDIVVIGGGIVGTAIVRELSKYQLDVVLVERHPDLAMGTTKANSAILHAGFAAHPGSLKARLNVRGNELYRAIQAELDLDIEYTGSLVVAQTTEEIKKLEELRDCGTINGVPGLTILSGDEARALEPELSPQIAGALWAPTAGVIWPFGAAVAFAENAVRNGARVFTECEVKAMAVQAGRITGVDTDRGFIAAKYVINAAGVQADEVSRLAGDDSFTIMPRKGEYILFDRTVSGMIKHIIFPLPTKVSKGILISTTVHGNMFIGPNAQDGTDKEDTGTSIAGMNEIIAGARKLAPNLPLHGAIVQFAGLRAVPDCDDFIIRPSDRVTGLIQAAGAESPGLTAAPAIAEMVADILRGLNLPLIPKPDFNPVNPPRIKFNALSPLEKDNVIKQNALYGRIICRCETVTEGEIVDAIRRPCGARTVDGVKRRVGAGLGRCQGGFCGPRVVSILARELNIPVSSVRKDYRQSQLFIDKLPAECEVTC